MGTQYQGVRSQQFIRQGQPYLNQPIHITLIFNGAGDLAGQRLIVDEAAVKMSPLTRIFSCYG
jgi:hypothetical protein